MTINDVEFSADLREILDELIAQLRANGIQYMQKTIDTPSDVMVCCPYHKNGEERKPSAGIRKSDGQFHCLACGEVHSLPEVISHCFGKDATGMFGWNWLLKNFASVEIENRKLIQLDYTRTEQRVKPKPQYVSEEELDSYRYYHEYWTKRKITSEWLIELFDLGFDPKTDCVTMPNRDINGNCLFVARRSVKTKFFNYPKGVEKPVYGLWELNHFCEYQIEEHIEDGTIGVNNFSEIIICESMIDALTCWQYGKLAVALNGLGTEPQMQELLQFPCRKYILATDMDERGLKAREFIKRSLRSKIVTEYLWDLSIAKDINDMSEEYFNSLEEYF